MRKRRTIDRSAGVSLAELLVVLAIIALAMMVAVPRINVAIKSARIRTVADQLTITLQAARMIAVSKQQPCFVTIGADPANFYTYIDSKGKNRHVELPHGVRIAPAVHNHIIVVQIPPDLRVPVHDPVKRRIG